MSTNAEGRVERVINAGDHWSYQRAWAGSFTDLDRATIRQRVPLAWGLWRDVERDVDIFIEYRDGATASAVAARHGLSAQRAAQIVGRILHCLLVEEGQWKRAQNERRLCEEEL
jgi:hypothetical protein